MQLILKNPEYFRQAVNVITASHQDPNGATDANRSLLKLPVCCWDVYQILKKYCWPHTAGGWQLADLDEHSVVPFTSEAAWAFVQQPYQPPPAATEPAPDAPAEDGIPRTVVGHGDEQASESEGRAPAPSGTAASGTTSGSLGGQSARDGAAAAAALPAEPARASAVPAAVPAATAARPAVPFLQPITVIKKVTLLSNFLISKVTCCHSQAVLPH